MKKFQIAATAAVMATASLALYAASPASAQKAPPQGEKTMTWEQVKARADRMWERLDVNKDGMLDAADRAAKSAEQFARIDTDKNGSISRDEFNAHHQQMKGHDGPRSGGHKGRKGGHGGAGMMMAGPHMAAMADANKDGTVTRAEFDAGVKAHFDMADANKDGKISPEERDAAMKKMMTSMPGGHAGHMGDGPPPPPPAD
jgi:hypothetical protein